MLSTGEVRGEKEKRGRKAKKTGTDGTTMGERVRKV